jgi:hypothetical protein
MIAHPDSPSSGGARPSSTHAAGTSRRSPGSKPACPAGEAIITGMKGASEVEREKKDKYTAHENLKIL